MANADFRPVKLSSLMACAPSVAVGDLVFQSETGDNTAVTCTTNTEHAPTFGVVTIKYTATTCEVLCQGYVTASVARGKVFLGADGRFASTPPSTGYRQHLGLSFGNGTVFFNPTLVRTKMAS